MALRAVQVDEVPPPSKPLTVAQAAESGSHRELLVAMRTRIAKAVQNPKCPPRDLAALTRRLQDIAREIEALDLREAEDAPEATAPDEAWDPQAI